MPNHTVHITVNRHPVTIQEPEQTGRSIKEAAIAQSVPIKIDFLLSLKRGQKFEPVGDNEHIRVHSNEEFRANDGDDNS